MIEFTVLKTKVSVSPLLFAVLTLFLLADRSGLAAASILFSICHEAGHFLALLLEKSAPIRVTASVGGIHMELPPTLSTEEKLVVFAAGFSVNFVLMAAFLLLGRAEAAMINMLIGVFTALPLPSTDGGSIVKEFFEHRFPFRAESLTKKVFTVAFFAAAIVLSVLIVVTGNYYLIIAVVYMAAAMKNVK